MARYFIGFLLAVGLIVVVVILIIKALTGTHKGPTPLDLPSYANSDVRVQLTIDSPVTSPDTHHDIILTVGSDQSSLMVTKGYDSEVVSMKNYPMTASAYGVFLKALAYNGFTKGAVDSSIADERGHCAQGDRYIYEVIDGSGNDLQRYWYSSCGTGTFKGNVSIIRSLFVKQFPDYSTQTQNISL
ncbi:MAG TPA: hypothetical protein VFT53_02045 [Candidatus Saccharimonadales bacterium]|nr:hypothetical protein [Candidatus Saccharimonadales bacterium]